MIYIYFLLSATVSFCHFTPCFSQTRINIAEMGADIHGHYDGSIRRAIDLAITTHIDTIYFPAGKYMLGLYLIPERDTSSFYCLRVPAWPGNVRNLASVPICNVTNSLVFLGDGYNSIIKLDEFPKNETYNCTGEYHLFRLTNSRNISFLNLLLDGNMNKNSYDEQRHLVQLQGSSNIKFKKVFFKDAKGDGIRLLGLSDSFYTSDISVDNCIFSHNGRSGISFQRFVKNVKISNNLFVNTNDQDIDLEPTFNQEHPEERIDKIWNVAITGNRFEKSGNGVAVTLTGANGVKLIKNVFVNSTLESSLSLQNAIIDSNRFINENIILSEDKHKIHLIGDMKKLVITNNYIDGISKKLTDRSVLAAIKISTDNIGNRLGYCDTVLLSHNIVLGHIIVEDAKRIFIRNCNMRQNSELTYPGLYISQALVSSDTIVISGNLLNKYNRSIAFNSIKTKIKSLLVHENKFNYFYDYAIYYDSVQGDKIDGIPEISNNSYGKAGSVFTRQIVYPGYIRGFHATSDFIIIKSNHEKIILSYKCPNTIQTQLAPLVLLGYNKVYYYKNCTSQYAIPDIIIYSYVNGQWSPGCP